MGFDLDDYRRALGSLKLPRFAVRPAGSPFIVAIEGSNGAGKTTLRQLLEQWPALHLITPGLDTKTTSTSPQNCASFPRVSR